MLINDSLQAQKTDFAVGIPSMACQEQANYTFAQLTFFHLNKPSILAIVSNSGRNRTDQNLTTSFSQANFIIRKFYSMSFTSLNIIIYY